MIQLYCMNLFQRDCNKYTPPYFREPVNTVTFLSRKKAQSFAYFTTSLIQPPRYYDKRPLFRFPSRYFPFSIISQVIIEICTLSLVENCVISCCNSPTRRDYNTKALIFKMGTARFPDLSEEETSRMKENSVALILI